MVNVLVSSVIVYLQTRDECVGFLAGCVYARGLFLFPTVLGSNGECRSRSRSLGRSNKFEQMLELTNDNHSDIFSYM